MINRTVIGFSYGAGEHDRNPDHAWASDHHLEPEEVVDLIQQSRIRQLEQGMRGTEVLDQQFGADYGPDPQQVVESIFSFAGSQVAWIPDWTHLELLVLVFKVNDIRVYTSREQYERNEPGLRYELSDRQQHAIQTWPKVG